MAKFCKFPPAVKELKRSKGIEIQRSAVILKRTSARQKEDKMVNGTFRQREDCA